MSSYLSNLLTQTTSKYNSLRRTLLSSEEDGDTEDDTHICRVLRAYYVEKGRQFPQWLPPDPNDRRSMPPQPTGPSAGYFTSAGGKSQYGSVQQAQGPSGQRGSLSDLWDPPAAAQPAAPMQPQSLRNARRPMPSGGAGAGQPPGLAPAQARPLPSQRAGSYQSAGAPAGAAGGRRPNQFAVDPSPPSSSGGSVGAGGGTAQDRLKARLWGAGRQSPPVSQVGAANPYDRPNVGANAPWSDGNSNSYDTGGGGGSRGGGGGDGGRRYGR